MKIKLPNLKVSNPRFFYFFVIVTIIFSILNFAFVLVRKYSKNEQVSRVLGTQTENKDVYTEDYWKNFLSLHPDYFPGLYEMAKISLKNGDWNSFDNYVSAMEKINPNSELLNYLKSQVVN